MFGMQSVSNILLALQYLIKIAILVELLTYFYWQYNATHPVDIRELQYFLDNWPL